MRIRRILILALMLIGAAILQSTLIGRPILLGARPDLVLLAVVTFSVAQGASEGLIGGLIGGLAVDLLSAVPFGAAMLGMGLVGLLTGLGNTNVYRASIFIPFVAVFVATVFYHSFLMLALQADGRVVEWISTLALQTIPGAAMNAALTPLAVHLIRRLVAAEDRTERFEW